MACHLGTFATFIPFGNIAVPLVIWLLKRDQFPLVADQGKEALNFQITMFIYLMVSLLLMFVVVGVFLFPLILIFEIVFTIIAIVRVNEGIAYRYPMTIPFL